MLRHFTRRNFGPLGSSRGLIRGRWWLYDYELCIYACLLLIVSYCNTKHIKWTCRFKWYCPFCYVIMHACCACDLAWLARVSYRCRVLLIDLNITPDMIHFDWISWEHGRLNHKATKAITWGLHFLPKDVCIYIVNKNFMYW